MPADGVPDGRWLNQVLLPQRLEEALARINPGIPYDGREEALRKLQHEEHSILYENNRRFHRFLTDGIDVEVRRPDGSVGGDKLWLVDFEHPEKNDWVVVSWKMADNPRIAYKILVLPEQEEAGEDE